MTISVTFGALALLLALASQRGILATNERARWQTIPAQAQVISQQAHNVLGTVLPPSQVNGSAIFIPPGYTMETLTQKPFHIYDDEFFEIIGSDPTLTLLAETSGDPLFHEAVVWNPPTDEVFFVQNAGAPAAGTGLNKSAIIQKISLKQVFGLLGQRNISGQVSVDKVDSPLVINPNGGTNYKGRILFTGEGQGNNTPPALFSVDPNPPYNATVVLNNYFGRQFNSLNDVAVNARNKDIYFTDVTYGYFQDFRPAPALPNQVYRLTESTGAVTVVADGFKSPNGITFSPDGSYAYVTDTGPNKGFFGFDYTAPSAIYRFKVQDDGTWEDRKTFAFIDSGVPDGIHCDAQGNVYAGCGDGVQVWNRSGKLLGKIFLGETSANFQFAGTGRMVICAETRLYYITLAASGAPFAA